MRIYSFFMLLRPANMSGLRCVRLFSVSCINHKASIIPLGMKRKTEKKTSRLERPLKAPDGRAVRLFSPKYNTV